MPAWPVHRASSAGSSCCSRRLLTVMQRWHTISEQNDPSRIGLPPGQSQQPTLSPAISPDRVQLASENDSGRRLSKWRGLLCDCDASDSRWEAEANGLERQVHAVVTGHYRESIQRRLRGPWIGTNSPTPMGIPRVDRAPRMAYLRSGSRQRSTSCAGLTQDGPSGPVHVPRRDQALGQVPSHRRAPEAPAVTTACGHEAQAMGCSA